jgi:hypothetical protein
MINILIKNKRGDIPSLFYAIVMIFVAAIVLFVLSHLFMGVYGGIDSFLESQTLFNQSEARDTLQKVEDFERSAWDYVFLAIMIGYIIMMGVLAFSTRISPIFYFIYGIAAIFSFGIGVVLSNTWQTIAANPEFAETIIRFPITNAIMGNFFPIFITVIVLMTMILLFGKFVGGGEGGVDR